MGFYGGTNASAVFLAADHNVGLWLTNLSLFIWTFYLNLLNIMLDLLSFIYLLKNNVHFFKAEKWKFHRSNTLFLDFTNFHSFEMHPCIYSIPCPYFLKDQGHLE